MRKVRNRRVTPDVAQATVKELSKEGGGKRALNRMAHEEPAIYHAVQGAVEAVLEVLANADAPEEATRELTSGMWAHAIGIVNAIRLGNHQYWLKTCGIDSGDLEGGRC